MRLRARALAAFAVTALVAAWIAVRAPARTPAVDPASAAATAADPAVTADPSASADPASADPASADPANVDPATSADPMSDGPAVPGADDERARVTTTEPMGVHIALNAPIVVTFDRPPPPEGVTLSIDPPSEGRVVWPDAQTLTFIPTAWAEGKLHRVQVSGPAAAPLPPFEFRPLIRPPARIEPGNGGRMLFTFDDGVSQVSRATALLDLLEEEQVQAIFFPTGQWAEAHPRVIERMLASGHRVCNHTYSHQNLRLPQLTDEDIRSEITRGAGAGTCALFRPPLRATDPRVERIAEALGYTIYLWDIDSRDWEGLPAEDIVNRVLVRARPDTVVLFHMHGEFTLEALPVLLSRLRRAGYVFRDLPDAGAPDGATPDAAAGAGATSAAGAPRSGPPRSGASDTATP